MAEKIRKNFGFRKSEYTRVFKFGIKKLYLRIFEVADFKSTIRLTKFFMTSNILDKN